MYDLLYEAWKKEKESEEVQSLPKNFYGKLAGYMKKVEEESRMLDEKTVKAKLLQKEFNNAKKMINDLIRIRSNKILRKVATSVTVPEEALTEEEKEIYGQISPSVEVFQALLRDIISGHMPRGVGEKGRKIMVLRFLKETPAIIGADMKTYGPFKPEDIATLPVENAKILVRQGVAVEVEEKF